MHIREPLSPYRNQLTPFHFQCPPYVWLACPSQQKVSASGDWWSCREGWGERERIVFCIFLTSIFFFPFHSWHIHLSHIYMHKDSAPSVSSALFHLLYKWVILPGSCWDWSGGLWELWLFRAGWIELSCICAYVSEYVMVVMSINSTANHCIVACPLWGTDN